MQIKQIYSHLNGLEFMLVHKPTLWQEIQDVIYSINADKYRTKRSEERGRVGSMLLSPVDLNKAVSAEFSRCGWSERRIRYFVNEDLDTSRQIAGIHEADAQRAVIESNGFIPYATYNQVDEVKDRVAIEVQFGKYFSVQYDLHVKHTFFYSRGDIDVGVEIIPTHNMMKQMSSGIAWYENELMNIVREGRSNPSVPIILIGIEP